MFIYLGVSASFCTSSFFIKAVSIESKPPHLPVNEKRHFLFSESLVTMEMYGNVHIHLIKSDGINVGTKIFVLNCVDYFAEVWNVSSTFKTSVSWKGRHSLPKGDGQLTGYNTVVTL